jgi:hypothetical protein
LLQTDLLSDVLMLLDEEHALYRELLEVAREQGQVLAGQTGGRSLSALMSMREVIYSRIDASERSSDSLLAAFDTPPEPIRSAAREIRETIREVLRQDRDNERLIHDLRQTLEGQYGDDEPKPTTH